jgi:nicotinamide/nicotinate riboside kinase
LVELDKETCWERRRNRTYDPEDQIGYFEGLAWPYYVHNLKLLRELESQILYMNGADSMEANFCQILNTICHRLTLPPAAVEPIREKCCSTG